MKPLSIVSLNCFDISLGKFTNRKPRLQKLFETIIDHSPDIICLQEITFRHTFHHARILLELAGYTVFPTDTHLPFLIRSGLLTASRLPILTSSFHRFADQGSLFALDIVERWSNRGYHRVTIQPKTGKPMTIINTHLHCPFGAFNTPKMPRTSQKQYEQMKHQETLHTRTILTGDLNIVPTNELYFEITKTLQDPLANADKITISPNNTNRLCFSESSGRIDYTLVSKDLIRSVQNQTIIFDTPVKLTNGSIAHLSDHYGVWTELSI
jgi:endonuclease/exonuclease/phosphatase family metal-dependent hydrolase